MSVDHFRHNGGGFGCCDSGTGLIERDSHPDDDHCNRCGDQNFFGPLPGEETFFNGIRHRLGFHARAGHVGGLVNRHAAAEIELHGNDAFILAAAFSQCGKGGEIVTVDLHVLHKRPDHLGGEVIGFQDPADLCLQGREGLRRLRRLCAVVAPEKLLR